MNKSQIQTLLSSYFKNVDAEIDVIMVGRIPYVDIQYVDFKPTHIVRTQLSAIIPHLEWTRLERTFSRTTIMNELWSMYREDTTMLIQEDNDIFRSTTLPIHVQERLQTKEFTQTQ